MSERERYRLHDVRIRSGMAGIGTMTEIDGKELRGIRKMEILFGLHEPNVITIEMLAESIEIEAGGEVTFVHRVEQPEP